VSELSTIERRRDGDLTPALYDNMCRAIDAAYEVDEAKDIRDKAMAMEVYLRQARNTEAERRACEIRLRAERKAGHLLKQVEKAKASPGNQYTGPVPRSNQSTPTLKDLGVTKRQAHDWQQLAEVPEDEFEAALADPTRKPSTAGIIRETKVVVPVAAEALWLWGRLHDFERDGLLSREPPDVLLTLTPRMLDEVHRLAPRVATWLGQIGRLER
jgi:hypothetical protein